MNKKWLFGAVGLLLGVMCCAAALGLAAWQFTAPLDSDIFEEVADALPMSSPTPQPVIEREPVPTVPPAINNPPTADADGDSSPTNPTAAPQSEAELLPPPNQRTTEQRLLAAELPERDQRLLAIRLRHQGQDIEPIVHDETPDYQLGDSDTFWITNNQSTPPEQFQQDATLRYITDHSYWWVAKGMRVDETGLARSAEQFEDSTYPTNRQFFGSEWTPGVDNDPRVHIYLGDVPGVAGYFAASNSYPTAAEPYSNEREMFFINVNAITPGNDNFDGVMAHEFQHMIHWHQDRNEDTWVNEGMSELATFINGYGPSNFTAAFTRVPDTQLNSWESNPGDTLANYGGSFLFMAYFLQRYGEEMTQAVVTTAENGVGGFDKVLAENGYDERFDDIFADFLVANYLQDSSLGDGVWGYSQLNAPRVMVDQQHATYPVEQQSTVYQYGSDYIELTGSNDLTLEFTGSTRVKVVDNEAHSGDYQWYSHRGDDTNTRLTRTVDLSEVESATLNYWMWYDIESDWDYGYVEVSIDDGQTWTILETPHSATTNPSGNAFGPGYTGTSGDGSQPAWIEETLDLSPYAGQEIQLRFEYVTDDAVNRPGWTIDDISIPEIDFFDDVEDGDNGWQTEGFVRIDNILPQRFVVQVIEQSSNGDVTVRRLPLDDTNYGTLNIAGLGDTVEQAVLIVSGLTPFTTQPANYQYQLTPIE